MPTSKIIYATSDSNSKFWPNNTPSDFFINILEPITLVTPGQVLSVCFKGIFIPGKITNKENNLQPEYIKIHVDQLDFQQTENKFDQCIARVPIENHGPIFIELPHTTEFSLLTKKISSIHFKITNENDQTVVIKELNNLPTIIKLEISAMDVDKQSFTITCINNSQGSNESNEIRYVNNSINGFSTWLSSELNLNKHRYQVGLTAAIIPKQVFVCKPDFRLKIQAYIPEKNSWHELHLKIKDIRKIQGFYTLFVVINTVFIHYKLPLYVVTKGEDDNQFIEFSIGKILVNKQGWKKSKFQRNWEDYLETSFEQIEENKQSCGDTCYIKIDISPGLMFLFSGMCKEFSLVLGKGLANSASLPIKEGFLPRISNVVPTAINIYSPLVSSTIVGQEQKNFLEIIPFKQNIEWREADSNDLFLYYPKEITYHDLAKISIKEISVVISNMQEPYILHANPNLPIALVLHFKPI